MLKRLWLVLSLLWAVAFIGNGFTRQAGVDRLDLMIGLFPLFVGPLVAAVGRYVVHGNQ
jgi:hypothetical protein